MCCSSRRSTTYCRRNSCMVWGYSTSRHLLLDLDNTTLSKAKKLVVLLRKEYPEIGSALICESSPPKSSEVFLQHCTGLHKSLQQRELGSYHVIFSGKLSWSRIMKIVKTLAELQILNKDYIRIRNFRGDLTLRVSEKVTSSGVKPRPKPVAFVGTRCGDGNGFIDDYLLCLLRMRL